MRNEEDLELLSVEEIKLRQREPGKTLRTLGGVLSSGKNCEE